MFNKTHSHPPRQTALNEVSDRSDAYIHSLTRSLSLALDEFYSTLRAVGVSSVTGLGYDDLKVAVRVTRVWVVVVGSVFE